MFIYFLGTERDRAWTGEGQRERETQNRKQAPGSEPSAQSPTRGSNSRSTRSWPGWNRTLNQLRHPGAPLLNLSTVILLHFSHPKLHRFQTNCHFLDGTVQWLCVFAHSFLYLKNAFFLLYLITPTHFSKMSRASCLLLVFPGLFLELPLL